MARSKKPAAEASKSTEQDKARVYTLDVFIISGPITEKFAKKNPVMSRTIHIRGDQTLEDLHRAILDAFGRWDEHLYEFQFGKGPMDPKALKYVLPRAFESESSKANPPTGRVDQTTIESLALKVGDRFGYWFDFGDDWWHQLKVEAIEEKCKGKFPKGEKEGRKKPAAISRRRVATRRNRQKKEKHPTGRISNRAILRRQNQGSHPPPRHAAADNWLVCFPRSRTISNLGATSPQR